MLISLQYYTLLITPQDMRVPELPEGWVWKSSKKIKKLKNSQKIGYF